MNTATDIEEILGEEITSLTRVLPGVIVLETRDRIITLEGFQDCFLEDTDADLMEDIPLEAAMGSRVLQVSTVFSLLEEGDGKREELVIELVDDVESKDFVFSMCWEY